MSDNLVEVKDESGFDGDNILGENNVATYSGDGIRKGRAFLAKFGVDHRDLSNEEVIEKLEKIRKAKAKSVEVLSRGPTLDAMDRILSLVPKGYVGEFKLKSDLEIQRAHALGWEVLKDKSIAKMSPTASSDGTIVLGDIILMYMPEEQYIANSLVKLERVERRKDRSLSEKARAAKETSDWEIPIVEM